MLNYDGFMCAVLLLSAPMLQLWNELAASLQERIRWMRNTHRFSESGAEKKNCSKLSKIAECQIFWSWWGLRGGGGKKWNQHLNARFNLTAFPTDFTRRQSNFPSLLPPSSGLCTISSVCGRILQNGTCTPSPKFHPIPSIWCRITTNQSSIT